MQIQILTGEQASGKTSRLRAIHAGLRAQGIDAPLITGNALTTPFFLNHLSERAIAGAKHFLADDCTQFQIKAVQELAARKEKSGLPHDLCVHLVRES